MTCKSRILFVASQIFLLSLSTCTPPPEYTPVPVLMNATTRLKRSIRVLDFENYSGHGSAEIGSGFSDRLVSALMEHDIFILLERQRLPELRDAAALGQSGVVTLESAVRAGNVMGAQAVITASISDFDLDVVEQNLGGLFDFELAWQLFRAKVTVNYRIVDVSTGKIIAGKRVSFQRTKPAVGFESDDYAFLNLEEIDNTLLGTLSREVVSAMAGE
ncbi:hypothetical protein KAH55_04535, partial [bacterium]|nr:hypothetical protein [bacterium]